MRKTLFLAAASAVLALASCTTSDDFFEAPDLTTTAEQDANAITFGTFLGQSAQTRAGATGKINSEVALKAAHFGVFAYFTGTKTYGEDWRVDAQIGKQANFMFNQEVSYELSGSYEAGYIAHWTYSPLKFWPNEVQQGGVDDQDNDTNTDPAVANGDNGGNLSFFAYAPYVKLEKDADIATANGGIVAINGQTRLAANTATKDPTITYVVPANGANIVDLLWGTYNSTSTNVNGVGNAGVLSTAPAATPVVTTPIASGSYSDDILEGYRVNADLTKQKTNGTVGFAFKHALASVGGYRANVTSTTPNTASGLLVVLDIDDQKGAESGFTKPADTKVTITNIQLESRSLSAAPIVTDGVISAKSYYKVPQGDFDLATGKWSPLQGDNLSSDVTEASTTTYTIAASTATHDAVLNENLQETTHTTGTWSTVKDGVTTTVQNVYNEEANPLVFIPGTYPDITVTIDYTVHTQDPNLAGAWTEVRQKIQKTLSFTKAVELNKQYTLIMHLGLTSVKFDAKVDNWENASAGDLVSTSATSPIIEGQTIYLPINVGDVAAKATFSSTEDKSSTVIAPATANKVQVTVDGLTESTTYTLGTDGLNGATLSATSLTTGAGEISKVLTVTLPAGTYTTQDHVFTIANGGKTLTVTVKQSPLGITASVASADVAGAGEEVAPTTYTVTDVKGTSVTEGLVYEADDTAGFTKDASFASNGKFTAASNNTSVARTFVVTIKKGEASSKVTFTQAAGSLVGAINGSTVTYQLNDEDVADLSTGYTISVTDGTDTVVNQGSDTATEYSVSGNTITLPATAGDYKVNVKADVENGVVAAEVVVTV